MEIDDVLDVDDLILINESMKDALSVKDIYNEYIDHSKYKKENIAIVDVIRNQRSIDDIPDGIVFMEYEGMATSGVYDATLELISHRPSDPRIPGLERYRKWFRFLPRIKPADMELIREEMEQYKKVLMAA
ncbi:MAG: hypothetical protein KAU58_03385, partial [Candidatus Omnitrophica bacterium]|nr:hypothetical protein [Candidatus Omnitrophota bacterium]